MDVPKKISQSWKSKGWNAKTRKWELFPVVSAKQTDFHKMKPVSRDVWFDFIRKGWLSVTDDLRKWLNENGYNNIKRLD